MNPKFSIIMPVYNTGEILRTAVDSILHQTYTDFELLLVDDGSKEYTARICDEYASIDSRIKTFHKKNGGISEARNFGLKHADGDYIGFCDHDDEYLPDYLMLVAKEIDKYSPDYVKVGKICIEESKNNVEERMPVCSQRTFLNNQQISDKVCSLINLRVLACVWDGFFARHLYNDHHVEFDTSYRHGGEDFLFNETLFKYVRSLSLIPNLLYIHYCRMSLSTSSKFYDDVWEHIFDEQKSILSLISHRNCVLDNQLADYNLQLIVNITSFYLYGIKLGKSYRQIKPYVNEYFQICTQINGKATRHNTNWKTTNLALNHLAFYKYLFYLFTHRQYYAIYLILNLKTKLS